MNVVVYLLAAWGAFSLLAVIGTLVFTFRLPRAEDPWGTAPEPSNVRVIRDGGAVRVDVAAWAFVLGLVALLALAGWAS